MAASRLLFFLALTATAADLEISRPARDWEFLDAAGPKASILGHEDGVLEAFVYPLKIFKNFRLRAPAVTRRIVSRPGVYTIVYSGDDFEIRQTLAASVDSPGAVMRLEIDARSPLKLDFEFTPDFQLMWPASIGTGYSEWNAKEKAWVFGADGYPYAAVFGSPGATDSLSLGTVQGRQERVFAVAGSLKSRGEALAVYRRLAADAPGVIAASVKQARDYLARGVQLDLPDAQLEAAYDWSRLSMMKGLVENPLLGTGLIAGYGPSRGVYRPGFAWFFGRDTFWTSFALTSAGDLASTRAAIAFIAKFQREDGKIPHEIAQSASLVPWFQNFPYGYASADATPLYVAAVRNYVQASGDVAFAREQWPRLEKAFSFMRAHLEPNGFPKNLDVGHGWVEGGPLLPVEVELYQAGSYLEALRSMAMLSRLTGDGPGAARLDAEFQTKQKTLEERFWLADRGVYAFALDKSGQPVDQPSVLATVPMWFGVLDAARSQTMIAKLSAEEHAADWGMRIISTASPQYGPAGYHFGSVWPLFTGWASVGEYRYHAEASAYANLRANAWLALDGAGGNATEVLSGLTYSPLSTASPHQIWSAAMVVSPLLRGLCGLEVDAPARRVVFAPHLPIDWKRLGIRNVPVSGAMLDFRVERDARSLRLSVVNHGTTPVEVDFAPAYAPRAAVTSAAKWREERTAMDWHPHFTIQAKPGESTLAIEHRKNFGYSVPYEPPRLGAYSENLKVLGERWVSESELELTVSGRAGHSYRVNTGTGVVRVEMPPGEGYVTAKAPIRF